MIEQDVIVIGAGAAGLMCASQAAKRGRAVTVLEHANKPGKKILMSGGGRCNFTNYFVEPDKYISNNPHFCKSALSRYTQWDFINLVDKHKIPYYEKTLGQLFCQNKSRDIVAMLLAECENSGSDLKLKTNVEKIEQRNGLYVITTNLAVYSCQSLVIASGGLSIPTMGASPFGYKIAEQFGLSILPTRAGLVPFTLTDSNKEKYASLAGVSAMCEVSCNSVSFKEGLLFTHRGLSGPSILQISSYWLQGETVSINLLPEHDLEQILKQEREQGNAKQVSTLLAQFLSRNIIKVFLEYNLAEQAVHQLSNNDIAAIKSIFQDWQIKPNGTEGYRTAEVTLGGVDVNQVSSKTMQANHVKGLYFIGEVLNVTGWLGGYNFQWAWSSGWVAGQYA